MRNAEKFGIKHGITIVEPNHDGCEFFFLGTTTSNNNTINKYLSNFQLLEKFIQNFKSANKDLFTRLYANRVIADDWLNNTLKFESINYIDKYSFLAELYKYQFTSREIECLPLLIKGYTSKQIAEFLDISHRTVEDYVNNIKHKMNIDTKNELILLLTEQFA